MNRNVAKSGVIGLMVASLVLAGCSGSNDEVGEATSAEVGTATPESATLEPEVGDDNAMEDSGEIAVDEGLLSTEVRLPRDLFTMGSENPDEFPTQEELEASIDEEGRDIEVSINDDGTVSYRMTRNEFNKFKDDLRASVDETIQTSINEESNIYKSVTYTDDLKEFEVVVDRKAMESSFSFLGFGLLLSSGFYQAFTGVDESDVFIIINYKDEKTGEVFDTYDSRTEDNLN
jgi:hypothetical protein